MGNIVLEKLSKKFGNVMAVNNVNTEIKDGEIVSFLGPSGCGKTTTLRIIAGLDKPTDGKVYIDNKLVSSKDCFIPPEKRNLGMVFQNYAIWPHMTVFHNVAYPLKLRKVSKGEIKNKVIRVLEMVGMGGYEARYPEQLSGGQQQRVALARAMIMKPTAMLFDEPLSNLDAKLREKMRFEIMDLHKKTGITVVYVTHDQAEAMVLSDQIVVMNQGSIQQIGTAIQIYCKPANKFVADFIGIANFIECKLVELGKDNHSGKVQILGESEKNLIECLIPLSQKANLGQEGTVFIRPEDITLLPLDKGEHVEQIERKAFLGSIIDYRIKVGKKEWRIETNPEVNLDVGEKVSLHVKKAVFLTK